jgi:hypothetical protein
VFEHLEGDRLTDRIAAAGRLGIDDALDIADQLLGTRAIDVVAARPTF